MAKFDQVVSWYPTVQFLHYVVRASTRMTQPADFEKEFASQVLYDRCAYGCYDPIEALRQRLIHDDRKIPLYGLGAGSSFGKKHIPISRLARSVATPPRYAQLLFRLGRYYRLFRIIELGTSLGLTTLYLSSISPQAVVVTLEGHPELAALAQAHFAQMNSRNIVLIQGDFAATLPQATNQLGTVDLAFLDGDHRKEATLTYFEQLLPHLHEESVCVLADIYWSVPMTQAWKHLRNHPAVRLSIDVFGLGLLFFNPILSERHLVLWY